MDIVRQSDVSCNVKLEGNRVYSHGILIDNEWEAEVKIWVDVKTFIIEEATWEIHRTPLDIPIGCYSINAMRGKSGYIDGKKELNILLSQKGGEMLKYMFNQCINGLIQAETCVYKQRGYVKAEDYDAYWDELEKNGCRMYSNKSEDDLSWSKYSAPLIQENNLFNRFKSTKIIYNGDKNMLCYGNLADTYHRINVNIEYNKDTGIISDCEILFSKAPGKACFTNDIHKHKLIGVNFKELTKKEIICLLGKSEGCYHLVEIVVDILRTIKYI